MTSFCYPHILNALFAQTQPIQPYRFYFTLLTPKIWLIRREVNWSLQQTYHFAIHCFFHGIPEKFAQAVSTPTSHLICFLLDAFMLATLPELQPTGQVKGCFSAQGWHRRKAPSSEQWAFSSPHSSHYSQSPPLLPPPSLSLTSARIHWPGKYLVSPSHQERHWP